MTSGGLFFFLYLYCSKKGKNDCYLFIYLKHCSRAITLSNCFFSLWTKHIAKDENINNTSLALQRIFIHPLICIQQFIKQGNNSFC